jgi:hypothetical protein
MKIENPDVIAKLIRSIYNKPRELSNVFDANGISIKSAIKKDITCKKITK